MSDYDLKKLVVPGTLSDFDFADFSADLREVEREEWSLQDLDPRAEFIEEEARIAEKMRPLIQTLEARWRGPVAKVYPGVCRSWPAEVECLPRFYPNSDRGMGFGEIGLAEVSFVPREQAVNSIQKISEFNLRELAFDHLYEHDPKSEVVFVLANRWMTEFGVFRLPLLQAYDHPILG